MEYWSSGVMRGFSIQYSSTPMLQYSNPRGDIDAI
jgi:hypothetical protein